MLWDEIEQSSITDGRLTAEYIQTDNRSLLEQLRAEPDA